MTYYRITFQYSEITYCTNIAHAENIQDVEKHYSKYNILKIVEADQSDIDEATRKGMPIIEIEPTEDGAKAKRS